MTPVHNRRPLTIQCLESLQKINRDDCDIEIFVVDDGSTDGTSEAIRQQFPDVHLIRGDGNLWYTEGTNVGVREALRHNPDYLLLINDDSIFDREFLQRLVRTAETHPRSIVGALLLLWDNPDRVFQVSPRWSTWRGGWYHWRHQTTSTVPQQPWEVDLIVGNCVLVPAKAFHEQGLMDSKTFPMSGDAEFTPRMKRNGWTLLVDPAAHVLCQPNEAPVRLRTLGPRALFKELILDSRSRHNLRARFNAYVQGGPSFLQGATAFIVFLVRILVGKKLEGAFGANRAEPPLSEVYETATATPDREAKA